MGETVHPRCSDPLGQGWLLGLEGKDGDDSRSINEHQMLPESSSKNALSASNPLRGYLLNSRARRSSRSSKGISSWIRQYSFSTASRMVSVRVLPFRLA